MNFCHRDVDDEPGARHQRQRRYRRVGGQTALRAGHYDPGGGIDVARVAHVLGGKATAVFPAGGGALTAKLVSETDITVRRLAVPARE